MMCHRQHEYLLVDSAIKNGERGALHHYAPDIG